MEANVVLRVPYANHGYGAVEIKSITHRAMSVSMLISSLLIVSAALSLNVGAHADSAGVPKDEKPGSERFEIVIPLPPPLGSGNIVPPVRSIDGFRPTKGVPVPVPDADADPMSTIVDQTSYEAGELTDSRPGSGSTIWNGLYLFGDDDLRPMEFVARQVEPKIVLSARPEYPALALRTGLTGTVHVKMWVDKQGKVREAIVVKSDHALFDSAAVAASRKWVFTPALMNNGPVSVWVTVPFRFLISEK